MTGKKVTPIIISLAAGFLITIFSVFLMPESAYHIVAFLYLLYISLSALYLKTWQVLFIAALSALAWNFLFLSPRFTFAVARPEDIFMLGMYFINASLIGSLTSRLKKNEIAMESRSRILASLYGISRELGTEKTREDIILATQKRVNEFFGKEISFNQTHNAFESTETYPDEERSFLQSASDLVNLALERAVLQQEAQNIKLTVEAGKLYGVMLNLVSHELRTPLTTIIGAATSLGDEKVDNLPTSRHALYGEIAEAGDRLNNLLENLLNMSRIEGGQLKLDRHGHNVQDLLNSALHFTSGQTDKHTVRYTIADDLPLVWVDYHLMERVFVNIISNCLSYSAPESIITIKGEVEGQTILILIDDDGPGFPREILDAPFVKFRRGQGLAPGGLGLGLSISKSIIDSHGGGLVIRNKKSGGAEYQIQLPLYANAKEDMKHE